MIRGQLLTKRYEAVPFGCVYVEYKLHFKFLFWAFVGQRRIQYTAFREWPPPEKLREKNTIISLSGVGWFPLEML